MSVGTYAAAFDGPGGEDIAGAAARDTRTDAEHVVDAWTEANPYDRCVRRTRCRGETWLDAMDLGTSVARGFGRSDAAAMRDLARELWVKTRGGAL